MRLLRPEEAPPAVPLGLLGTAPAQSALFPAPGGTTMAGATALLDAKGATGTTGATTRPRRDALPADVVGANHRPWAYEGKGFEEGSF
ncbi:hypothetical protein [Kitasatospora sp. NPDC056181]|uniref:hypothetical protein n=1 Tax=Kitasatospora sp. NPDC056181 TaxID=3345737 RepID=UPI0035DC17DF